MSKIKQMLITARKQGERGELSLFEADQLYRDYGITWVLDGDTKQIIMNEVL